jgi:hypothetical protein
VLKRGIGHQPAECAFRTSKGEVVQEGHPVQHDASEGTDATRRIGSFGSDGMTMLAVDDPSRPARVARVRDEVAAGRYRPPVDAVAERLLAFLARPVAAVDPPWPR